MATPERRGSLGESRSAVSAIWIVPPDAVAWLVVGHGAGAGMEHPFLAGFCRAMEDERVATATSNLMIGITAAGFVSDIVGHLAGFLSGSRGGEPRTR